MSISQKSSGAVVTYPEMIAFFLPVAASMMLMMTSHSIVSSALARTVDAAMALAAYSVAKSISDMFQSPCITLRRMCVALFKDQESYDKVLKLAMITCISALIIMAIVVFTPLSKIIFIKFIGLSEELLPHAVKAFTILLVMPILAAVRSFYQGAITVSRKTYLLTIATAVRISVMFLLATFITSTQIITGSVVGSTLMVAGLGTEAIIAFIFGRKFRKTLPEKPIAGEGMNFSGMWLFFLPLVAAQFAMTWGQPSVNAGLARAVNPEISLAAYQVGRSFAWIFIGMFGRVHQLVLVFAKDKLNWQRVRIFSSALGLIQTTFLLLLALTPIGEFVLLNIIGVEQELMKMALSTIFIMAFIPLVISQSETYTGLLIRHNRTPVITLSKIFNIIALITTVFLLSQAFPTMGSAIGGWSSLVGYGVELGILFAFSRKVEKNMPTELELQTVS